MGTTNENGSARNADGRARVHHLIPESFLLRFADSAGLVLVTDKTAATRKLVHPRVLMTQRDYYTIETIDGPSDVIERWLGEVEGNSLEVMRRIKAGIFPPKEDDRALLSLFVALQLLRGTALQEMHEDMVRKTTEMQVRLLVNLPDAMRAALFHVHGRLPDENEIKEQQAYMLRALEENRIGTSVPRTATIDSMLYAAPTVAAIVAHRSWMLVRCDRPVFVTGDTPVAMWSPPLPDGRMMPVGVGNAREITFAIDPCHCILLGNADEASVIRDLDASAKSIEHLNERHFLYARRFVFQHPSAAWAFNESTAIDNASQPPKA
jgi:hypothetical protein